MIRALTGLTAVCLLLVSFAATANLFVPDSRSWSFWATADESSSAVVDHGAWQALLDAYLRTDAADGINRFDYAAVTSADRERLNAYLATLGALDPRELPRAGQRAYWINLYNALTVQVVLAHYPVKSIRRIYGGLLGTGPWNEPLIDVAGQPLTLNDIEHRILRPIWRDPRIHYAVNCASLGCPDLAAEAYTDTNAERLLEASARAFVNHPRGAQFANGRLTLSSLYDWYDVDFGANDAEMLEHLATYAQPALAARLRGYTGRIRYDYDWTLNAP
mgnify:CR=1 FL=1